MQREELFLTAAQSFFAVAVISNLPMSLREAGILFGLFWVQFILGGIVPEPCTGVERIGVGILYLVLGVWVLVSDRFDCAGSVARRRSGAPYDELAPSAKPTRAATPAEQV